MISLIYVGKQQNKLQNDFKMFVSLKKKLRGCQMWDRKQQILFGALCVYSAVIKFKLNSNEVYYHIIESIVLSYTTNANTLKNKTGNFMTY